MESFNHIAIAGVGSIGSFLAQTIVTSLHVNKISLVDFDIVEERNIGRSIFSRKHIGKNKANAVEDILKVMSDVEVDSFPFHFTYDYFRNDPVDLVIDCRDMITYRDEKTVKITISGDNLIVDGRRFSNEKDLHGSYVINVDNSTLIHVSNIIVRMINKGVIEQLLRRNQFTYIPIESSMENQSIPEMPDVENEFIFEDEDIVYDVRNNSKISNISNAFAEIETVDKHQQVELDIYTSPKSNFKYTVDINSFESPYLAVNFVDNILQDLPGDSYIVIVEGNRVIVTPEDGGA